MRDFRCLSFFLFLALVPALASADVNSELYRGYQKLLSGYLFEKSTSSDGLVSAFDYQSALADNDLQQILIEQRETLEEFDAETLDGQQESVAFWINAYNFFMLDQILTEQPDGELVNSVWDYGGRINPFVDSVFERKKFVVGGRRFSLSQIEKEILLGDEYLDKGWKDARVHFAVNCASVGCPPLRDIVYTAANLEDLLAENTRRAFLTDRHLEVKGKTLYVTELFKWYEEDFKEAAGSRKSFIGDWVDSALAERVVNTSRIEFIDYDWALNKPTNFQEFR